LKTRAISLQPALPSALERVSHVVAIASGKGGVGKSTVAVNLAVALRETSARVGLLDADIYGPSQPGLLGAASAPAEVDGRLLRPLVRHGVSFVSMGLLTGQDDAVVWRAPMAIKMIQQFLGGVAWGELDYLLVDLPPGTGDVQLSLAQQAYLTGAVIVTTPQQVALRVARRGLRMFEQVGVPILGVVENMSGFMCDHCGERTPVFGSGGGRLMASELEVPFLGALPLDPRIMTSGEHGAPLLTADGQSAAGQALRDLADRFRREVAELSHRAGGGPVELSLGDEGELRIRWSDGHETLHRPYNLRLSCQCAGCIDERTGQRTLDPRRIPLDVTVAGVQAVGRYALALSFSDGHDTGIYDHALLRETCECEACRRSAGQQVRSFRV
jgi:ATP-binding protein involved in chromosome partitioning